MLKVNVLGLSGCHWCRALTGELDEISIPYSLKYADDHDALADYLENLLGTKEYPIMTISDNHKTLYYIYRPDSAAGLGLGKTSDGAHKIGCSTIKVMLSTLQEILNKY